MFTERVRAVLTLVVGSSTFAFPSGSLESFSIDASTHSFEASASVYVSSELDTDALFAEFITDQPIKATLSVTSTQLDDEGNETPPIKVVGHVFERSMVEQPSDDVDDAPIIGRSYRMRFADAATVYWREHRPLELHTDTSMQEVIDMHRVQGMEISYDWARLGQKQEVLMVATGADGEASFYDLVIWFIARHGGHFELDAAVGSYRIASSKARPGDPVEVERECVARVISGIQAQARHKPRVLNGSTLATSTTEIANELAAEGVLVDTLVRTPIASEVEVRERVEQGRLSERPPSLRVIHARFPPQLVQPGMGLVLSDEFGERMLPSKRSYRVTELRLSASAAPVPEGEDEPELTDDAAAFEVALEVGLEQTSDPRPRLPRFRPPRFPVLVEGKVVSSGGGDEDRTWMTAANQENSLFRYTLKIPLWNKKVPAPFEPGYVPGHMFFPAYKDQRVLVALGFSSAAVHRFLDWAANARTPLDGQGDRLVLGYQASNGVVVDHIYTDAKPVFSIKRTFGNDLQTLIVSEGTIFWQVKEDPAIQELQPRYDVTVVVNAAKEQVKGAIQGAIGEVTGAFEGAMGGTSAHLEGSIDEVSGAVGAAEAKLTAKLEEASAKLEALSSGAAAALGEVSAAVSAAKAELQAALEK